MRVRWKRGLSLIVSASMAMSLVPTPALAEMLEQVLTEEAVIEEDAPIVVQGDDTDGAEEEQSASFASMALDESYEVTVGKGEYWAGSFTATESSLYEFFS